VKTPNTLTHSEAKKTTVFLVHTELVIVNLLTRFSSLEKILRIVSYIYRFAGVRPTTATTAIVSAEEFVRAFRGLIRIVQHEAFLDDLTRLQKGDRCSKTIRHLDPFIDETGLLRVGGRLDNAEIQYAHKHPILLPARHRLTDLLIDHHHIRLRHPGANSLQAILQREFWILSARQAIRSRLRLCIPCFRVRPRSVPPKMASLPNYRVQQIKPFASTGVDYAVHLVRIKVRSRDGGGSVKKSPVTILSPSQKNFTATPAMCVCGKGDLIASGTAVRFDTAPPPPRILQC